MGEKGVVCFIDLKRLFSLVVGKDVRRGWGLEHCTLHNIQTETILDIWNIWGNQLLMGWK